MKRDLENRADIDDLMIRFYGEAMSDETIGYIFEAAELDLKHHLPIIGDFWETLLFRSDAYQKHGRNPLRVHAELHEKTPLLSEHFERWLEIFREKVDESFTGERADFINLRAEQIATRMFSYVRATADVS
jgi:hemoglobin